MQFVTVVAALFATSALAAPQFGFGGRPGRNNGGWNSGRGGNEEGPYQNSCTCVQDGYDDAWLGRSACDQLSYSYPNLGWDGRACVDYAGQGVEYNGFRRACQNLGAGWRVNAQCY
ncbi:hypothetical protein Slin14017_G042060 [Septoria linicola]|nr:hypothetical protein Slin14017_G042060 [Septoria linicola]